MQNARNNFSLTCSDNAQKPLQVGAQPRLISRGGQGLGPNTGPAKGRVGCWVRKGYPPPAVRVGGITPGKFF